MKGPATEIPFHRPVKVLQIRQARQMRLSASVEESRAITRHLGLHVLENLEVVLEVRPWRRHGLRVDGQLQASIGQICTLSAEPMTTRISETFNERFYPREREDKNPPSEAVIDIESTSDYEAYDGDTVDLGALMVEILTLAIDPYPKKTGAVLQLQDQPKGNPKPARTRPVSPFSELAGHFSAKKSAPTEYDAAMTGKSKDSK